MILESLQINIRAGWEEGAGSYRGLIRFKGQYGTVELALTDEVSKKLLAVVGDAVVDSAREVATSLTADVFAAPRIESLATV